MSYNIIAIHSKCEQAAVSGSSARFFWVFLLFFFPPTAASHSQTSRSNRCLTPFKSHSFMSFSSDRTGDSLAGCHDAVSHAARAAEKQSGVHPIHGDSRTSLFASVLWFSVLLFIIHISPKQHTGTLQHAG